MRDFRDRIPSSCPPDDKAILIRENEDVYKGKEIPKKDIILDFMNSLRFYCVTTGNIFDHVKEKEVPNTPDCGYCDGVYYWEETDIYHFEKYNMPLKAEFIEYVLKNWKKD